MSGDRVTRLASLVCVLLAGTDIAVTRDLGLSFDVGFVVVCVAAAFAVRPRDLFRVGVLPPILLAVLCVVVAVVYRSAIARPADGLVQSWLSGLAGHAGALGVGYGLALGVLAMRVRVMRRRDARIDLEALLAGEPQENLETSPAPVRAISGEPEEKSTTVVGDEPHSPESRTASSS
jgi:hypothetical protein